MNAPGFVYLICHISSKLSLLTVNVQLVTSIKENPRLRAAAEELKKQGGKVGDAVGEALRTMEESEIARTVSTLPTT
jgi:hypothetical protein